MPVLRPPEAEVRVRTFRDGPLARLAHDLELRLGRFELRIDGDGIEFDGEAGSLEVVGVVRRDGTVDARALGPVDRALLHRNLRREVLRVRRFPAIRLRDGRARRQRDGWRVEGTLELCGAARPVAGLARREGDRVVARFRLHQPDWGIRPFSAMMGAMRVRPEVVVLASVPGRAAVPPGPPGRNSRGGADRC